MLSSLLQWDGTLHFSDSSDSPRSDCFVDSPFTPAADFGEAGWYPLSPIYPSNEDTINYGDSPRPDELHQIFVGDYVYDYVNPVAFACAGSPTLSPLATAEAVVLDTDQGSAKPQKSAPQLKMLRARNSKHLTEAEDTLGASPDPDRERSGTSAQPKKDRTLRMKLPKPLDSDLKQQARTNHNCIEKRYRHRLNTQFERLLTTLSSSVAAKGGDFAADNGGQRTVSKGALLELAQRTLVTLEKENQSLTSEVQLLRRRITQTRHLGRQKQQC